MKLFTKTNLLAFDAAIASELLEAIKGSEHLDTVKKCQADVIRVEGGLSPSLAEQWLRGLPLGVAFATYDIAKLLCEAISVDVGDLDGEQMSDLDEHYWKTMGRILANI